MCFCDAAASTIRIIIFDAGNPTDSDCSPKCVVCHFLLIRFRAVVLAINSNNFAAGQYFSTKREVEILKRLDL